MAQVRAGVVDFQNVNEIKKKSVRGLLRKRAKKYESESDSSEVEDGKDSLANKRKQKVVRKSMASAFKMIMSKKLSGSEDDEATPQLAEKNKPTTETDTILAKYKKKERDLDEKKAEEEQAKKKAQLKERQRLMGRRIPTTADAERERHLAIIATRGVV